MQLYTRLLCFCNQVVPTWRKSQRVNLALLAQAIAKRHSLVLTELARAYPIPTQRKTVKPKHGLLHRLKRLWRFLDNPRPDHSALMLRLVRLSCSDCRSPGLLLPVLVDLTYFEPFAVLSANVPRGGRALPVAWRTFRRDLRGEPELSQNLIVEGMLAGMRQRIAPAIQVVIVADREFAAARFFRFLKCQGMSFAIRVDAQTWLLHPTYSGPLGDIGLRPGGRRLWLEGALYAKEEQEPVNLLAVWAQGQKEPWFIASDLTDPRLVERLYRKRMKIEHGYRDWKHHLRLKGTLRVRCATHLAGLLTAIVLLYWYLCLIGQRLRGSPLVGEACAWGRLGDFKLGLELLAIDHQTIERTCGRLVRWTRRQIARPRTLTPTPPMALPPPPYPTPKWVFVRVSVR
jgi:hypothetical protein